MWRASLVKRANTNLALRHLNGQHLGIVLNMEVEKSGRLPSLDTSVWHDGRSLTTSVYRKPTDNERYLKFGSHHPLRAKRSIVSALLSGALRIFSENAPSRPQSLKLSRPCYKILYDTLQCWFGHLPRRHASLARVHVGQADFILSISTWQRSGQSCWTRHLSKWKNVLLLRERKLWYFGHGIVIVIRLIVKVLHMAVLKHKTFKFFPCMLVK